MEFSVLGLPSDATIEEAKKALRKIQAENHPDKNREASVKQLENMKNFVCLAEEAFERIFAKKFLSSTPRQPQNSKLIEQNNTVCSSSMEIETSDNDEDYSIHRSEKN